MIVARQLRIHGRVQGVFFRAWTVQVARALGLSGWVRNRHDGTVEAVAEGEVAAIERLIRLAHDGPPKAVVERIEVADVEPGGSRGPFEQRPTA